MPVHDNDFIFVYSEYRQSPDVRQPAPRTGPPLCNPTLEWYMKLPELQ